MSDLTTEVCAGIAQAGTLKWYLGLRAESIRRGHGCEIEWSQSVGEVVRIAGPEGPHALCARLSRESGDRIGTVDLVIWRAANLKLA